MEICFIFNFNINRRNKWVNTEEKLFAFCDCVSNTRKTHWNYKAIHVGKSYGFFLAVYFDTFAFTSMIPDTGIWNEAQFVYTSDMAKKELCVTVPFDMHFLWDCDYVIPCRTLPNGYGCTHFHWQINLSVTNNIHGDSQRNPFYRRKCSVVLRMVDDIELTYLFLFLCGTLTSECTNRGIQVHPNSIQEKKTHKHVNAL